MIWIKVYITFIFALVGAVMGSFLNCWAMRYAKGEKVPRGRSACPKCGHTLGPWELVPIFSWLFLRGRCKSCHEPISPRYPLTELIGAGAFAGLYLRFGLTLLTAELAVLTACMMLLSFIDFDTMTLPGAPMAAALLSWAAFLAAHDDWRSRALQGVLTGLVLGGAILLISLVMDKLLKRESLGGGDIKLLALVALYLGPVQSLLMLILSCIIGLVFALLLRAKNRPFPFGPSICAATWLTLLIGSPIAEWYLGLF